MAVLRQVQIFFLSSMKVLATAEQLDFFITLIIEQTTRFKNLRILQQKNSRILKSSYAQEFQ